MTTDTASEALKSQIFLFWWMIGLLDLNFFVHICLCDGDNNNFLNFFDTFQNLSFHSELEIKIMKKVHEIFRKEELVRKWNSRLASKNWI